MYVFIYMVDVRLYFTYKADGNYPHHPQSQKRFLFTCVIIIYFYPRLYFNFLEISCRSNFGCSKLVDKAISKDLYRFESSVRKNKFFLLNNEIGIKITPFFKMMKFFKEYFINEYIIWIYEIVLKYKYIKKWSKDMSGSLIRNAF